MAIEIPNMIQIGSTGRNSGKTTLAEALIKQYQEVYPIYGLKIITISGQRGVCQRGTKGCGICTSITAGYELVEEQETIGNKDTMKLLAALIICESNSLRNVVQPGLFLMMNNQNRQKESAKKVIDKADFCLLSAEIPKELRIYYQGEQLQVSLKRGNKKECVH